MIARWHPIAGQALRSRLPPPAAPRASSRSGPSCFSAPSRRKRRVGRRVLCPGEPPAQGVGREISHHFAASACRPQSGPDPPQMTPLPPQVDPWAVEKSVSVDERSERHNRQPRAPGVRRAHGRPRRASRRARTATRPLEPAARPGPRSASESSSRRPGRPRSISRPSRVAAVREPLRRTSPARPPPRAPGAAIPGSRARRDRRSRPAPRRLLLGRR